MERKGTLDEVIWKAKNPGVARQTGTYWKVSELRERREYSKEPHPDYAEKQELKKNTAVCVEVRPGRDNHVTCPTCKQTSHIYSVIEHKDFNDWRCTHCGQLLDVNFIF